MIEPIIAWFKKAIVSHWLYSRTLSCSSQSSMTEGRVWLALNLCVGTRLSKTLLVLQVS